MAQNQVYLVSVPLLFMNHNQRNPDPRNRKKTSIDGVSSRPVARFSQGAGSGPVQSNRGGSQIDNSSNTNTVGDFSRRDGFYSSSQQQITTNRTTETFVIDRKVAKKPKLKKEKHSRSKKNKNPMDFSPNPYNL